MATKDTDSCYQKAEPGEELFTLLARSGISPYLVWFWALLDEQLGQDPDRLEEAYEVAEKMGAWRKENRPNKQLPTLEMLDKKYGTLRLLVANDLQCESNLGEREEDAVLA